MWTRSAVVLVFTVVTGCGSATAPGGPGVYDLTSLRSGSEPTSCGRTLQSAVTSGTLTLAADGTATFDLRGWYDYHPTSLGTCPAISRSNTSIAKTGTYTLGGDAVQIVLRLPGNTSSFISAGHIAGRDMTLTTVNLSPFGAPFTLLQPSTWHRR